MAIAFSWGLTILGEQVGVGRDPPDKGFEERSWQ